MKKRILIVATSFVLVAGLSPEVPDLVRAAAAAPVLNVAARRAALSKVPVWKLRSWCRGSMRKAQLYRTATIRGPIRR